MFSRPQEDLDPGLSVKKAKVPLPRLRGARPSTGLGSATSPHCHWPATSPPPLGESCTHRPCHPHPSCPLLKGPDGPDWCIPLKYIWTWCYSSIKRRKLPSPLPLSTQTKRQPKCKEIENLLQMHILAKCSANINNATVLRVAVRGSKRALGTKPTVLHFPKYTSQQLSDGTDLMKNGTI